MPTAKKIIIVDDHETFRQSLRLVISKFEGFEIVGEAADARQAESIARSVKPALVVVDLSLPDRSGIQLTRILKTILPDCGVVIVSMHSKIDYILGALRAGACGYLVKESVSQCLLSALEAAVRNEYFLDPALSQEVVAKLLDSSEKEVNTDSVYGSLTPREQEVLRLLAQGIAAKSIAEKLFISVKTVNNHRANIMSKLDLHSTAELVRYAATLGLLEDVMI